MDSFFSFSIKYLPYLLEGTVVTVEVAALSIVIGSILGIVIGIGRVSQIKVISQSCRFYIWLVRGTPLLLQLFIVHFALPAVNPILTFPPFVSAVIAFSINSAAYIAEIARGTIQSIDTGQNEAARSLGFSRKEAMWLIIFPQAFRRMLPPLGNECIALIKESSLVSTIALYDLLRTGQQVISSTYRYMEIFTMVAIIYLVLTTVMSFIVGTIERKVSLYE
ncbi:amino acid ABC transporter permease [Sporolactobacillus nakayamae]|uniref:Polar amino acid transport system permease protein n=1 Tax=Sporolactobacillus nakayamae TaxID=269670 RepID=A0A1I2SU70_9BACL|nr:amino acid ABC transporter permease [Sporolactobacillus nakayamae]SFG56425.1 polar amino acid transport system permease protein [Sporolactobacillus nakayamae]